MTYLLAPRLVFAGRFLADVSTLNNIKIDEQEQWIPGWNAPGSGAFDLIDCAVSGAWLARSKTGRVKECSDDPCLRYIVTANPEEPSAKMVDLDPSWQLATELWGLRIQVSDRGTGEKVLSGSFNVAAFRDMWTRQRTDTPDSVNGEPQGARYVSTLSKVDWGEAAGKSEFMRALREQTDGNELSICFHQFGFFYTPTHPRHRTGSLIGAIGVRHANEPRTAIVRRRIDDAPKPDGATVDPLSCIDVDISADNTRLAFDLGHALPIENVDGTVTDLGDTPRVPQLQGCKALVLAVKKEPFVAWNRVEVDPSTILAEVDDPFKSPVDWYRRTGGIVEIPLSKAHAAAIRDTPLAIYARLFNDRLIAVSCETTDGIFVRAENFVHRMDPGDTRSVEFFAQRYGRPAANVPIYLSPPKAQPFPPPPAKDAQRIGRLALHNEHEGVIYTNKAGKAQLRLTATDPGQPRRSIDGIIWPVDGQLYTISYSPQGQPGYPDTTGTGLIDFDVICVHVRGQTNVPEVPQWDRDVQPILADYALLYPVMSKHLFDIADRAAVESHRAQMLLAFSRSEDDPNYMPVTRDMSKAKRDIITRWLRLPANDRAAKAPKRTSAQPSTVKGPTFQWASIGSASAFRCQARHPAPRTPP
jgi:hypothetical protein